ncbi:MAG: hypothetical protein M0Z99_04530 [Betaproteobacteria bacterium]|nr:hypothetical protein [Betaproteobacteria bacterium]
MAQAAASRRLAGLADVEFRSLLRKANAADAAAWLNCQGVLCSAP